MSARSACLCQAQATGNWPCGFHGHRTPGQLDVPADGSVERESQPDFLGPPGLWAPPLRQVAGCPGRPIYVTVNFRKMTPGHRSVPSLPVPLPRPYRFERQEQRTIGTPVGVQRRRRARSHQTTPEAGRRCRPSTGRKLLACPGSRLSPRSRSGLWPEPQ